MKKILSESLHAYLHEKELFKGQVQTGLTPEEIDKKEFLVGLTVEKKHSDNLAVQKELVLQNLAKNPKYYSEGMKKGMFDDVEAINTYKKYFIDKEEVKESMNENLKQELINTLLSTVYSDYDKREFDQTAKWLGTLSVDELDSQLADYYMTYNNKRTKDKIK